MMVFVHLSNMMTRSAIVSMLGSSCDTTMNVTLRFLARLKISSSNSADVMGSSPAEGSSRKRIGGSSAMEGGMAARFLIPPLISSGSLYVADPKQTNRNFMRLIV